MLRVAVLLIEALLMSVICSIGLNSTTLWLCCDTEARSRASLVGR